MAAGFTYNLTPEEVKEERYDVETGRRRRGPYKLDTASLPVGEYLPSFTPIAADLKKKTATVCVRAKVVEAYTNGGEALTIKVAKGSLLASGMYIGNGSKGAQVSSIDKTNASYDTVTIAAQFGANLSVGDVLFEARIKCKHRKGSSFCGVLRFVYLFQVMAPFAQRYLAVFDRCVRADADACLALRTVAVPAWPPVFQSDVFERADLCAQFAAGAGVCCIKLFVMDKELVKHRVHNIR